MHDCADNNFDFHLLDDEIMKPIEEANEQAVPNGFLLTVTPGSTDESNSAGTYVVFPKPGVVGSLIIRKKRVFINKEKRRIAFYNGSRFVITSTSYTTVVLLGATGGLYRSQPTVHPFVRGKWGPVYDMKPLYVR